MDLQSIEPFDGYDEEPEVKEAPVYSEEGEVSPAENDSEQSDVRSEDDCAMRFLQQMRLEMRRLQAENESLRAKLEAEKEKSKMWKTQVNQKARKNAKLKLQIIELEE